MHQKGVDAEGYVKESARTLAQILKVTEKEILFTSGGTESNNLALIGGALANKRSGNHIITTAVEHAAVSQPVAFLQEQGFEITYLPVDHEGKIKMSALEAVLRPDTIMVSTMLVNNEVGAVMPVEEIAKMVHEKSPKALYHVDAIQGFGKYRIYPKKMGIDLLAVSGHKIHAPKGIGALYLSDSLYQAFQAPYLGGEQEREKRPGTENLPYALGLAAAATRLNKTMKSRDAAVRALNLRLREGLKAFPEVVINSPDNAVPEVLNFSENCIKSETMLAHLAQQQVYVSSASACGRGQPSHTLAAMGRDPLAIDTAIRVSFCADNTPEDVDAFLNAFEDGMKHLQRIKK